MYSDSGSLLEQICKKFLLWIVFEIDLFALSICLEVSADGELVYILERGKISSKCVRVFGYSGDLVREFAMRHSELKHPWCLCVSEEGQVMVSDGSPDYGTLGHSVRVFSKEGKQVGKIGCSGKGMGQFKDPRGLVIDSRGNLIVVDSGNHRLQIF